MPATVAFSARVILAPVSRAKLLLARVPRAYVWAARGLGLLRFALRRPHEPDFAAFALFAGRPGMFLDVGANVGQSALSFRAVNRTAPILSVEANPQLARDLRFVKRFVRGFDYRICAASDARGVLTLHVPLYRGLPITGEASLDEAMTRDLYWTRQQRVTGASDDPRSLTVDVQSIPLDDLDLTPAFVKLDVQGFELRALKGLAGTLAAHKPVLLVERTAIAEVTEYLAAIGYRPYVYLPGEHRLAPDDGRESLNLFFLHVDEGAR
jgi:FkbM family methyltransferase